MTAGPPPGGKGDLSVREVYLDHAATTPVDERVWESMSPYLSHYFGNPSGIYRQAREARQAVEEARESVAALIGALPQEIVFTSGGSEADNLALRGVARARASRGRHIITSAVEHHAVLDTVMDLEKQGFETTILPVDEYGRVDPADLRSSLREDTILVSIMMANNEVGTLQPLEELAPSARERGVPFHTDAVQAVGQMEVDVGKSGVDLLTLSGHKFYGPKGAGALYVSRGITLEPMMTGGSQERKRRPGTENVAGIVGLGKAAELAAQEMRPRTERILVLRDRLVQAICERIPHVRYNGHPRQRLANNAHFAFSFIEGESLILNLDLEGIAVSSGSACTSGSLDPSHVLLALGLDRETAHGSLRLTLGKDNEPEDVDRLLEVLPPLVQKLRDMSPLYNGEPCQDGSEAEQRG